MKLTHCNYICHYHKRDQMQFQFTHFYINPRYCNTYYKFKLINIILTVKKAMLDYVNHARILSWNQPVLSNDIVLYKETFGALDEAGTYD